jgi:hypothetical protein
MTFIGAAPLELSRKAPVTPFLIDQVKESTIQFSKYTGSIIDAVAVQNPDEIITGDTIDGGHSNTGSTLSITFTVTSHVAVLPLRLVTVHVTVCTPAGNKVSASVSPPPL